MEDWGEKNVGLHSTVLAVLDTYTGSIQVVVPEGPAADTTVGQPVLLPDPASAGGTRLVYSGWSTQPRRYGKLYCMQRPCGLFQVSLGSLVGEDGQWAAASEHRALTPSLSIAHSARPTPDGQAVVFVGRQERMVTHHGCLQLWRLDNGTAAPRCLVDIVRRPANAAAFPGLFSSGLPAYPFISQTELVLNTQWRSRTTVVAVHADTGVVRELGGLRTPQAIAQVAAGDGWNDLAHCSTRALDVCPGRVLFGVSAPNCPERYGVLDTDAAGSSGLCMAPAPPTVTVTAKLDPPVPAYSSALLASLRWQTMTLTCPSDGLEYECTLLLPAGAGPHRVLLVPHGGPHSCLPTSFVPSYAFLAAHLNMAVLHCNYRGSVGFGQDSIESLPGHIGTNDVADCMDILEHACKIHPSLLDASRVGVAGGSHGGFLTGHLIGQFPDRFKVAAMRNPVTNIPPMVTTSDISDWCYVEALGLDAFDFDSFKPPLPPQLAGMYAASPIAHVAKVPRRSLQHCYTPPSLAESRPQP